MKGTEQLEPQGPHRRTCKRGLSPSQWIQAWVEFLRALGSSKDPDSPELTREWPENKAHVAEVEPRDGNFSNF